MSNRSGAIVLALFDLPFVAGTIGWFGAAIHFAIADRWYDATMCSIGGVVFASMAVLIFFFAFHCFKAWRREGDQSSLGT